MTFWQRNGHYKTFLIYETVKISNLPSNRQKRSPSRMLVLIAFWMKFLKSTLVLYASVSLLKLYCLRHHFSNLNGYNYNNNKVSLELLLCRPIASFCVVRLFFSCEPKEKPKSCIYSLIKHGRHGLMLTSIED